MSQAQEHTKIVSEIIETVSLDSEPLQDHNYYTSTQNDTINKVRLKRMIKVRPKITKLTIPYNCKLCGYSTWEKDVIETHKETHRSIKPGTIYKPCYTCNLNKDVPAGYHKCPKCTFSAKSISSLKVHMHIHDRGTAYKCTECSFRGKDLKELANHYRTAKTFCELCTFSSHFRDRLQAHKKMHSEGKRLVIN